MSLLDNDVVNQPFSLPDAVVEVKLSNGDTVKFDCVEMIHTVQGIVSSLGEKGREAASMIPLFQKRVEAKLGKEISYSDAYGVFKLCDAKFDDCKKKLDLGLKSLLTIPESMPEV